ncbi:MAG TPA: hypothetical protein VGM23_11175 [Armatimonadota bacterium]
MAEKKTLMTCDVKDFIAAMNPDRGIKRKSSSACSSVKRHHRTGR